MRMRVVETTDSGNETALRDAACYGRAAAVARRRALAAGRLALAPVHERRRTGPRGPHPRAFVPAALGRDPGAPTLVVHRGGAP